MTSCSVAEATARLADLIERALNGEPVVITREGQPAVELRPLAGARTDAESKPPRRITEADLEWLRAHRGGRTAPAESAGALVSQCGMKIG